MPRTTLDLDPTVLEELRERASAEGKSMGQVSSELLAAGLRRSEESPERARKFTWRSYPLGEPLVDLDDKDALYAALDAETDR